MQCARVKNHLIMSDETGIQCDQVLTAHRLAVRLSHGFKSQSARTRSHPIVVPNLWQSKFPMPCMLLRVHMLRE